MKTSERAEFEAAHAREVAAVIAEPSPQTARGRRVRAERLIREYPWSDSLIAKLSGVSRHSVLRWRHAAQASDVAQSDIDPDEAPF